MRRVALIAPVVPVVLALAIAAPPGWAAPAPVTKTLTFDVVLHPVDSDVHTLPGDVTYGQSRLAGTTTWGRRSASVEWMCSHVSDGGTGPTQDLVTITRSDGAVLALAVTGWVSGGTLKGTVDVIGGKGRYRGATGTGTVTGRTGKAHLALAVSQPRPGRAAPRGWGAVGC